MKIIISPAKKLNEKEINFSKTATQPFFIEEAKKINAVLQKKSPENLSKLMGLSLKLSELNWERNQRFTTPFTIENSKPAVFLFMGDVYLGIDVATLPKEKLMQLQEKLRILSGLYGVLKPLDLIQPYRLEMGTQLAIEKNKNLYAFWQKKITAFFNDELNENEVFVNLASKEYFSAVDFKTLKTKNIITPHFKDFKNGQLKSISFFAKKARGLMTRYIIDNNANSLSDLLGFDYEGYQFSEKETKKENEPVFVR